MPTDTLKGNVIVAYCLKFGFETLLARFEERCSVLKLTVNCHKMPVDLLPSRYDVRGGPKYL